MLAGGAGGEERAATARLAAALEAPTIDHAEVHSAVCAYVHDAIADGRPVTGAIVGLRETLRRIARRRHTDFEPFAARVVSWCIEEYYRPR